MTTSRQPPAAYLTEDTSFPLRPFQARNPQGGLPCRRSGLSVGIRPQEILGPIYCQERRPQSPDNPQPSQRRILARPPYPRQARNRFQLPALGLRTPQIPRGLLPPLRDGSPGLSENTEELPKGTACPTPHTKRGFDIPAARESRERIRETDQRPGIELAGGGL